MAGTAALLWHAIESRPPFDTASAHVVRQTLVETASASTDAQVTRILDVPAAMDRVFAGAAGSAPTVQLLTPTGDLTVEARDLTGFEATASDPQDGPDCCTLRWTSDVDGLISVAHQFVYAFPTVGVRRVSVVATDSSGQTSAPVSFQVNAVNPPPVVSIVRPAEGAVLTASVGVAGQATISDPNQDDIGCSAIRWDITGPQALSVIGCRPRLQLSLPGSYTATVTATDEFMASASVSRVFTVEPYPPNVAPRVQIFEPDGGEYVMGTSIPLRAEATLEPGEVSPVQVSWAITTPRGRSQVFTTTMTSGNVTVATGTYGCDNPGPGGSVEEQTLTFSATDDDGSAAASVTFLCKRPVS